MNGVGERTGNANLVSVIAGLQLKLGRPVLDPERLAHLTEAAHFADELFNRAPNPQPAVRRQERLRPQGRACTPPACAASPARSSTSTRPSSATATTCSCPSWRAARRCSRRPRPPGSEIDADAVIERVKALEHAGYQFEAADGSFELLLRKEAGVYEPLFTLESWRCIVEQRADGQVETEATIKIWVDGERYVRTAEGNGPVHALDAALRAAITEIHPHLADIELVNFKVRILDETKGTGAVTRVLLDASDGQDLWGSIGVHENVIAASWQALVDSLEQPMQPGKPQHTRAADAATT